MKKTSNQKPVRARQSAAERERKLGNLKQVVMAVLCRLERRGYATVSRAEENRIIRSLLPEHDHLLVVTG